MTTMAQEAVHNLGGVLSGKNIQAEIAPDMPEVFVDRVRLAEALQNLIENAVKFTHGVDDPQVKIGVSEQDGERVFYVADNGIGIDSQYHERIFNIFDKLDSQTEGTGIGLALVKRIIEAHDGHIWLESAGNGKGSTFFFTLPEPEDNVK